MRRPIGRLGFASNWSRSLPRRVALAAGLALLIAIGGGSGMGSHPLGASGSSPARSSARPSATVETLSVASGTPVSRTPIPSPTLAHPPPDDIGAAIDSVASWAPYTSAAYRFTMKYPADWQVSETQTPGWAVFSGWDESNVSVTWRLVPRGTALGEIKDEVWKVMHDNGFTVDADNPGTIAGLPARILIANGTTPTGHARHGIIGIVVTATGRYRVELWSRPGTETGDMALYNILVSFFAMT